MTQNVIMIKTVIESAVSQMKTALIAALNTIDSGEVKEIDLGPNISWNLLYTCLLEQGWRNNEDFDPIDTNGWQVDFWTYWISPTNKKVCISGSLYQGLSYKIEINDDGK